MVDEILKTKISDLKSIAMLENAPYGTNGSYEGKIQIKINEIIIQVNALIDLEKARNK